MFDISNADVLFSMLCTKDRVGFLLLDGELYDKILDFSEAMPDGLFELLVESQDALRDLYREYERLEEAFAEGLEKKVEDIRQSSRHWFNR